MPPETSSWSQIFNFTTRPIPMPGPPVPASPANLATSGTAPANLTWNAGAYATTYQVQVAISHDFFTIIADVNNITTLSKAVTGLDWTSEYFWRLSTYKCIRH